MKKLQRELIQSIIISHQTNVAPGAYHSGNAFPADHLTQSAAKYFLNYLLAFSVLFFVSTINCPAQKNTTTERDGQHDFDFNTTLV